MVVMTRMYSVVGMICGHLMCQNTWKLLAPSTCAASMRDGSTLPSAAIYSTMGWPMEVVNRIRMMQASAVRSSPSQLMFCSMRPSEDRM